MFKNTNQVQTVDVNEWVNKLLAAHDDMTAVRKLKDRLDTICEERITDMERDLNSDKQLYDFYYRGVRPIDGDTFLDFVADTIGYDMRDDLAERWQNVCAAYWKRKDCDAE
jgi:helix-turn-helix protein